MHCCLIHPENPLAIRREKLDVHGDGAQEPDGLELADFHRAWDFGVREISDPTGQDVTPGRSPNE